MATESNEELDEDGRPKWIHDPQRDGAGCTWCGDFAQVNSDNLCENCHWEDTHQDLMFPPAESSPYDWTDREYVAWLHNARGG